MSKPDPADPIRRILMSGGTAVLAAAAAPALAQSPSREPPRPLTNPVEEYPRPPFEKQQQPWPGLASRMTPPPDHGETSYKGSGRLIGRRALITGGDSGMGRAAAIAFAREGADVAINYLPAEQSDADDVAKLIRAAGRKALLIPGDLKDETFCRKLVADAARQLGGLDILVNCAARQFARVHPGHFQRGFRRDLQDERLRDVLADQGRHSLDAAGRDDHQHRVGQCLRSG